MLKNSYHKICELEEKLAAAPPAKVASIVKKLIRLKDDFINN